MNNIVAINKNENRHNLKINEAITCLPYLNDGAEKNKAMYDTNIG